MFQAINLWPQWSMWHFCDSVNWEIRGFRNISGIFEIFVTSNLVVNKILPVSLFNEAEIMISHFLWTQQGSCKYPPHSLTKFYSTYPQLGSPTHFSCCFTAYPTWEPVSPSAQQQQSHYLLVYIQLITVTRLESVSLSPLELHGPNCHTATWPLATGWSLVGPVRFWTGVFAPLEHLLSRFVFSAPQPHNTILDTPYLLSEILKSWIQHKSKR